MSGCGRVYDVWRGRTKAGEDAWGIETDIADRNRCFWATDDGTGVAPVARGDQVTFGPHHYTVNGGPERKKLGWLFDRTDPALFTS